MKVTVIPGRFLSSDLIATWRDLQGSNPALANPYFCPEFTQAIAHVRDDVEIAIVEEEQRIAAFFPYQRSRGDVGDPVGGQISDYQGLICGPDFVVDPPVLLRGCGLKGWRFDHLLAAQTCFRRFYYKPEVSRIMDLSRGYAHYAASTKATGSEHRKMRRLASEHGPLSLHVDVEDKAVLDAVLAWKSEQYRAGGNIDTVAIPWVRAALSRIHDTRSEHFGGILSALYAGDVLVAGHFGMRSRTVWHYWFPAYSTRHSRYSPGLALLLKMAEAAQSLGLPTIDLGKGPESFKPRFANASIPIAEGRADRSVLRHLALRTGFEVKSNLKGLVRGSNWEAPARQCVLALRRLRGRAVPTGNFASEP